MELASAIGTSPGPTEGGAAVLPPVLPGLQARCILDRCARAELGFKICFCTVFVTIQEIGNF